MKRQQKHSVFEFFCKTKKAQAALEFLTTYGWAFLMMTIALGALLYFNVLNPGNILPERCSFSNDFHCLDFKVMGGTDQNASLILINTYGQTIVAQNVTCEFFDGQTDTDNANQGTDWSPKQPITVGCRVPSGQPLVSGEKTKVFITVWYRLESGGYDHFGEGEVYANVQ